MHILHLNQRNQRNQILFQYLRDKKKKKEGGSERGSERGSEKGGGEWGENSPISPPLDPRLDSCVLIIYECTVCSKGPFPIFVFILSCRFNPIRSQLETVLDFQLVDVCVKECELIKGRLHFWAPCCKEETFIKNAGICQVIKKGRKH